MPKPFCPTSTAPVSANDKPLNLCALRGLSFTIEPQVEPTVPKVEPKPDPCEQTVLRAEYHPMLTPRMGPAYRGALFSNKVTARNDD